jgi:hypothetical protein
MIRSCLSRRLWANGEMVDSGPSPAGCPIITSCWSGSFVSFRRSAELGLSRDEVTDALRRPPGDCLDVMRQTIITVGGMEAGHGPEMFEYMVGQIAAAQLLVAPLLQRYIDVSDGSAERRGKLPRHTSHVLRLRPGQFVNLADMSGGISLG